jgi:hypothetical protein
MEREAQLKAAEIDQRERQLSFERNQRVSAAEAPQRAANAAADEKTRAGGEAQLQKNADYWNRATPVAAPQPAGGTAPAANAPPVEPRLAGKLNGNPVEIADPNTVTVHLPGGGTSTYKTMHQGQPVLAGNYLLSHPDFEAHPEFAKAVNAERDRQLVASGALPAASTPQQTLPPATTGELVKEGLFGTPQPKSPNAPADPGAVYNIAAGARSAATGLNPSELAGAAPETPNTGALQGAISGIGKAASNAWGGVRNLFAGFGGGGGGGDVAAGASNAQAARIQTPTEAAPVPVTPTSPAKDLSQTDQSTAPAAAPTNPAFTVAPQAPSPLPDEWANKRYQFAGF